jgi:tetratricopeptide (TPR) repeat protein
MTGGNLAGAEAAFERALRINEAAYGPDHPRVARDVNDLGRVLRDRGDLAGAEAAFERALRIDEATYGPHHPDVATIVNNLGSVLRDRGDLAGAAVSRCGAARPHDQTANAVRFRELCLTCRQPATVGADRRGGRAVECAGLENRGEHLASPATAGRRKSKGPS